MTLLRVKRSWAWFQTPVPARPRRIIDHCGAGYTVIGYGPIPFHHRIPTSRPEA